jgi:hypothetical protein
MYFNIYLLLNLFISYYSFVLIHARKTKHKSNIKMFVLNCDNLIENKLK